MDTLSVYEAWLMVHSWRLVHSGAAATSHCCLSQQLHLLRVYFRSTRAPSQNTALASSISSCLHVDLGGRPDGPTSDVQKSSYKTTLFTQCSFIFRRRPERQMKREIWKRKQKNAQRDGKQGDRRPGVQLRWPGWDDQPDAGQQSRNLAGLNPVTCDLIFSPPPSDRSLRVELCIINLPPNRLPSTLMIASLWE